ncbi:hypothetical protein AR438_06485 [Chryseobacterium aquaticum]|uniref:Uncharacterized protein n=2 Tax=Chryseobacterium aquaticum TaxID=452084 RepID=A0A0Q3KQC0_9FLAO|nr:hypothetical protein AR438_06485 [Chryseobacterium aquaticum]
MFDLKVSDYQRPYLWDGEQALNLAENLKEFTQKLKITFFPDYYLGTIILVKKGDLYEIIDGQQRIITLLIIAHLMKCKLAKNQEFKIYSKLSEETLKKNSSYLKLVVSSETSIDFDRVNLTYIIAENDDQAFKFYTTLSTSGKRLSGIDIIKPFHLQAVKKSRQEKLAIELERYQFRNAHLDIVVKILLRSRYLNGTRDYKEFPRQNYSDDWKTELELEFVKNAAKKGNDVKYLFGKEVDSNLQYQFSSYQVRQPLNKGENAIQYFLYFCKLWERITLKIKDDILTKVQYCDGIDFNYEYYQAALITYVSRFGEECLDEDDFLNMAKLLFKVSFFSRLSKPVTKKSVHQTEKIIKLLDRIAFAYEKEEIKLYCELYMDKRIFNDYIGNIYKHTGVIGNFTSNFNVNIENRTNPFFNESL